MIDQDLYDALITAYSGYQNTKGCMECGRLCGYETLDALVMANKRYAEEVTQRTLELCQSQVYATSTTTD